MATNFPTGVDNFPNPTDQTRLDDPAYKLSDVVTNIQDAIEAVETYVLAGGVGGGGTTTVQDEGTNLTPRTKINFTGTAVTATDDAVNSRTNVAVSALVPGNNLTDVPDAATARTNLGAEPSLGNPGTSGYLLSSTTAGTRSWVAPPSGGGAHLIQDEGVALPARNGLNFSGSAVAVTDDSINNRTNVAVTALLPANNLSDVASQATARTNLGLGTAATQASTAFEPALGNPGVNGYVLSSTTGGARSWIAQSTGGTASLPWFNVKDYGALGNGSTNDTTAIAAAITAAPAGSTVVFPAGTYIVTLDGVVVAKQLSLVGMGRGLTVIKAASSSGTGNLVAFTPAAQTEYCRVEGIKFDLTNTANATGLYTDNIWHFTLKDLFFWNGAIGLYTHDTGFVHFSHLHFEDNTSIGWKIYSENRSEFYGETLTIKPYAVTVNRGIEWIRTTSTENGGFYCHNLGIAQTGTGVLNTGVYIASQGATACPNPMWLTDSYIDNNTGTGACIELDNVRHFRFTNGWVVGKSPTAASIIIRGGGQHEFSNSYISANNGVYIFEFANGSTSAAPADLVHIADNLMLGTVGFNVPAQGSGGPTRLSLAGNRMPGFTSLASSLTNLSAAFGSVAGDAALTGSLQVLTSTSSAGRALGMIDTGGKRGFVRAATTGGVELLNDATSKSFYFQDTGGISWNGGATITAVLSGSAAWTPGAIGANAGVTTTVTVTGAVLGNQATASYNQALNAGLVLNAWVSAADTVTVQIRNVTAGSFTPTAGNVKAVVWQI